MLKIGNLEIPDFPIILAPMEDISDPPFRYFCKKYGADLVFSEFISSEGLVREAQKSLDKMDINDYERPVAIQIFGHNSSIMAEAAQIISLVKPDIIDLNFGCPVKKVVNKGAGAALLKNPKKMIEIAKAVVEATKIPVTVKTRLGWDKNSINIETISEQLQDVGIEAISIHGRTAKQMYKAEANWKLIDKVKQNLRIKIPIFGNGDIKTPQKAREYKEKFNIDGILIGRAAIGNPWIFKQIKEYIINNKIIKKPEISEISNNCKEYLKKSVEWKGEKLAILEARKHYSNFFKGLYNFKPFKTKLMESISLKETYNIIDDIEEYYSGNQIKIN